MPTQLTPHFTLEELIVSQTAVRHGLNNKPSAAVRQSLLELCVNVLEPLRVLAGQPITVSSGYRSVAVNAMIGGAPNSQHIKGEAADINCPAIGQQALFDLIRKSNLPFDQVIDEFKSWVHVSYTSKRPNRRQPLKARKVNGATKYTAVP